MQNKHLFTFSLGTKRITIVVLGRGVSIGPDGISVVTKRLTFCWMWPSKRPVKTHPYADELGMYYKTLRELKASQGKPNVAISLDKCWRIH